MFLHIFGRVSKRKRSENQLTLCIVIELGFIGTDVKCVSVFNIDVHCVRFPLFHF